MPLDVSNDLLRRQVTLIGSWTFSTIGQAQCARFIADRGINVDHLFTHHWRIDEADRPIACSIRKPPARASFHPS